MPDIVVNLWTVILGAASGAAAILGARRGNRLLVGAVIGAVTAVVLNFLRGFV